MVKEVNKEHKNVKMTRKKKRSKKDEKNDRTCIGTVPGTVFDGL